MNNTSTDVVVGADISALGIQGDEQIAIRKHLTLGDIFQGAVGLTAFTDAITIYNEDGPGTTYGHLPDGAGGFISGVDFVTATTDAPVYPGTGFVINNVGAVTVTPTGTVKESDTQVVIYGGSIVNIVSAMKPLSSVDVAADNRLNEALADYTDAGNTYTTDGSLAPAVGFLDDGAGGFVSSADFVTPVTVNIDGTYQPIVVNAASGTVYKVSGVQIP